MRRRTKAWWRAIDDRPYGGERHHTRHGFAVPPSPQGEGLVRRRLGAVAVGVTPRPTALPLHYSLFTIHYFSHPSEPPLAAHLPWRGGLVR